MASLIQVAVTLLVRTSQDLSTMVAVRHHGALWTNLAATFPSNASNFGLTIFSYSLSRLLCGYKSQV